MNWLCSSTLCLHSLRPVRTGGVEELYKLLIIRCCGPSCSRFYKSGTKLQHFFRICKHLPKKNNYGQFICNFVEIITKCERNFSILSSSCLSSYHLSSFTFHLSPFTFHLSPSLFLFCAILAFFSSRASLRDLSLFLSVAFLPPDSSIASIVPDSIRLFQPLCRDKLPRHRAPSRG